MGNTNTISNTLTQLNQNSSPISQGSASLPSNSNLAEVLKQLPSYQSSPSTQGLSSSPLSPSKLSSGSQYNGYSNIQTPVISSQVLNNPQKIDISNYPTTQSAGYQTLQNLQNLQKIQ